MSAIVAFLSGNNIRPESKRIINDINNINLIKNIIFTRNTTKLKMLHVAATICHNDEKLQQRCITNPISVVLVYQSIKV